jgi:hypothetical protein
MELIATSFHKFATKTKILKRYTQMFVRGTGDYIPQGDTQIRPV